MASSSSPPPPTPLVTGPSKRVAVVGAGASGLAAAYKLKLNGIDVTVYEADRRAGGKIRSNSQDGFIWDEGANTMTETEADVGFLLDSLKIRDKQQLPLSQHKRYIAKDGAPMMLPSNPIALVGSSFLSTGSKIQMLLEPFLWKKNEPSKHESVGNFFQRHFGKEVVDSLVDPFLAGTTGGDPESLSMRHTFPDLWNLEQRYGSIISGAILSKVFGKKEGSAKMKGTARYGKRPRGSFSFLGGMQTLTDALCKELGKDELKLDSRVLEFSSICNEGSSLDSWSISCESPGKKKAENKSYDAVIVTAPLNSVKDMKITKRGVPFLLDFIPEINYISMAVITTAFRKERVEHPLEGFGVLIPSKETQNGLKTLGTLFSSMMFPDRAPSDMHLYTTFVGGTRNRELAGASWDVLKGIVASDLQKLLGAKGEPVFVSQYNWNKAFPLYGHNYHLALEAIDKLEKNLPGFFYAGNHRGGLSVGKAIASGCCAADLVMTYFNSCSDMKRDGHSKT